jgi:AbiV family abortive infection protein
LLVDYRDAALANAEELIAEAELLLHGNHYARAYFLAVSAVEEIGKAVQAFDGMGRNLFNPAVRSKLQTQFEDHSQQVTSAFVPWLIATPDLRSEIMEFVNTMVDVKYGREPSMYTDILPDGSQIVTPRQAVQASVAKNCVALTRAVLGHAKPYVLTRSPTVTTRVQDAFFALNQKVFLKMTNTADFWEFYVTRAEAGDKALEGAVTEYHDRFFVKGTLFKQPAA